MSIVYCFDTVITRILGVGPVEKETSSRVLYMQRIIPKIYRRINHAVPPCKVCCMSCKEFYGVSVLTGERRRWRISNLEVTYIAFPQSHLADSGIRT